VPTLASSLVAAEVANQNGFTGSKQALQLRQFFPLQLIHCIAIVQGVIKLFSSSSPINLSASGEVIAIDSMFCGR
jgi:hypothetical protein